MSIFQSDGLSGDERSAISIDALPKAVVDTLEEILPSKLMLTGMITAYMAAKAHDRGRHPLEVLLESDGDAMDVLHRRYILYSMTTTIIIAEVLLDHGMEAESASMKEDSGIPLNFFNYYRHERPTHMEFEKFIAPRMKDIQQDECADCETLECQDNPLHNIAGHCDTPN